MKDLYGRTAGGACIVVVAMLSAPLSAQDIGPFPPRLPPGGWGGVPGPGGPQGSGPPPGMDPALWGSLAPLLDLNGAGLAPLANGLPNLNGGVAPLVPNLAPNLVPNLAPGLAAGSGTGNGNGNGNVGSNNGNGNQTNGNGNFGVGDGVGNGGAGPPRQ